MRKLCSAVVGLVGALALAACGANAPQQEAVTSTTTIQRGQQSATQQEPQAQAPSKQKKASPAETCDPSLDLMETELGTWLQDGAFALENTDTVLHVQLIDDQFDPCAPVSAVAIQAENGSLKGPNSTVGARSGLVVPFHYDKPATDQPLRTVLGPKIEITEDTVNVTGSVYNGLAEPPGEEHFSFTLEDDTFTPSYPDAGEEPVDFGHRVPTGKSELKPLGNVNNPSKNAREVSADTVSFPFGSAGQTLACDVYSPEIKCLDMGKALPYQECLKFTPGEGGGQQLPTRCDRFFVNFSDRSVRFEAGTDAVGTPTPVERGDVISVNDVRIDLTGDGDVVFERDGYAVRASEDGVVEVPASEGDGELDTSKHRTDVPFLDAPLPSGAELVENREGYNVYKAGPTSAEFASATFDAWHQADDTDGTVTLDVHSPVTGQNYKMTCVNQGHVACTGGNNAQVYIEK